MPIHWQLWSAERNRNIELPENNDVATAATFIASHPSPLEGSRGNETAKMLSAGLCLTETSKKMLSEMQSQIRKDIAGFLNATFLPPFHLNDLTLNPWPRNQGILTPVHHPRKVETFTCNFGNTWFGVPKNLNIRQVSKRMFSLDLRKYKTMCLVLLSSSPGFQVRKGAGVYRWERYVAILMSSKWNQSCALTGRYQWEHQTVSKTYRPSAARGGWLWPDMIPSINRLWHCRRATC